MSILDVMPELGGEKSRPMDDVAAIEKLHQAFALQKKAFQKNSYPNVAERRERLEALAAILLASRKQIIEAVHADFGNHPTASSELVEMLGPVGRVEHMLANFEQWMQPDMREADAALFGSASISIRQQPKGVIGNIVPWNFPIDIGVGPLVDMLAAGNRVIIKPSDYTPACAEVLTDMMAKAFDPDLVTVISGGLELARAFSDVRWDHLLYTGSPNVGREVMMSAARNLVPVTLELGGKCPAVMTENSVNTSSVASILQCKLIKNGQMCISVDHCFVPRGELDKFIDLANDFFDENLSDYSRSLDCCGMISEQHLDRVLGMVEEARDKGYTIIEPEKGGVVDRATRRMPLYMVINPGPELAMMQDEIFGPILPVIAYDNLDDVVASVNAGESPLGVYVFGDDEILTEDIVSRTSSGGAVINSCAMQGAIPSLGFGGVGMSGMGRHHGLEGFLEFSNPRGVVVCGGTDPVGVFSPPYQQAETMIKDILGG